MGEMKFSSSCDNPKVLIFDFEGRDIPIEVVGPLKDGMDKFIDAIAEFLFSLQKPR